MNNCYFSYWVDVIKLNPISVIRLALNFRTQYCHYFESYSTCGGVDFSESLINILRSVSYASTYATIIIYYYVDSYWRHS